MGGKKGITRNKAKANLSFLNLLTLPQIKQEEIEDMATIMNLKSSKSKQLRDKIIKKVAALKELKENINKESSKKRNMNISLIGLFSYNIKHNPLYKDLAVSSMPEEDRKKYLNAKIKIKGKGK
jgi:hypothetical protein